MNDEDVQRLTVQEMILLVLHDMKDRGEIESRSLMQEIAEEKDKAGNIIGKTFVIGGDDGR